jgi:subtilisin family serine protease
MAGNSLSQIIAIRKEPRVLKAGLSEASPQEKRLFMRDDAPNSDRREKLEQIGLSQLQPESVHRQIDDAPLPDGFIRLGYIGAYLVSTTDKTKTKDVEEELAPDYHILTDEYLLNLPTTLNNRIRSSRAPATRRNQWPEWTGISHAHKSGVLGTGVQVMVLDTGCDADHAQFYSRKRPIRFQYVDPRNPGRSRDKRGFDSDGHGTHVCGIIAGKDIGVSPDVDLFVASVIESETVLTSLQRVLVGLNWLLREAIHDDVNEPFLLNMSLGFLPHHYGSPGSQLVMDAVRDALRTLVEGYEVLPIVAAGNDGPDNLRAPAIFPEVLAVGAINADKKEADFTSRGVITVDDTERQIPDIWGIGDSVYSSLERDKENNSIYALKSGTSMAAPYVTGIAALCAQEHGLQGKELRSFLLNNALDSKYARFV